MITLCCVLVMNCCNILVITYVYVSISFYQCMFMYIICTYIICQSYCGAQYRDENDFKNQVALWSELCKTTMQLGVTSLVLL